MDGEWSPLAQGKSNDDTYPRAADKIQNGIVLTSGGVTRRPGTQYVGDIQDMLENPNDYWPDYPDTTIPGNPLALAGDISDYTFAHIVPFVFNREEAYQIILVGNGLPASDSDRRLYVLVYDPSQNALVRIDSVLYTFDLNLSETQYAQTGDILVVCNRAFKPFYITRSEYAGEINFSFDQYSDLQIPEYPYMNPNAVATRLIDASATTGSITLTANFTFFDPNMVGAVLTFEDSGTRGFVVIDTVSDANSATGTVIQTLPTAATTGSGSDGWALNAFNNFNGWPAACCFFQERLVFGGTKNQPDTSYFSALGNLRDFNNTILSPVPSSPFSYTVAGEPNLIQWYSPGKVLNMGTKAREFIIRSADTSNLGIAFDNISASPETSYGSRPVMPIRADNSPVFVDRSGYKLREFTYNFDEDAYRSKDLLENGEHLPKISISKRDGFESSITNLAFHPYFNCILAIDENGYLFSLTRDRQQAILAGARQELGGSFDGGLPFILSLNSLPSFEGKFDDVYFVVKRTINGATKVYLERMGIEYLGNSILNEDTTKTLLSKPFLSDSAVYVNNSPADSIVSGLDHLEGEEVDVWADGFYEGRYTVDSGEIEISEDSTHIVVGLPYRTIIKPLELEAGSQIGSSISWPKRIDKINMKFVRTIGAKFGVSEDDLETLEFRPETLPMNEPIPLFTGTMPGDLRGNYESSEVPIVVQDLPMPFTLVCIIMKGATYD